MLLHSSIIANTWWARTRRPIFTLFHRFSISSEFSNSISLPKTSYIHEDDNDFLPWLEHKAGAEISSALSIGRSSYGRALYAAKNIQAGDCLLKVPYSVQLAPDNLPPEITCLLGDEVSNVAKVALLIIHEKKLGKNSQWAPYIGRLPQPDDLHSTIFWSEEQLEMSRPSALYGETLKQKTQIEKDFHAAKLAFDPFPDCFPDVTLPEFTYAYGLVTSRAWESSRGVSLIPFADFLNHDGTSHSYVLSDEGQRHSVVIADRDSAPGDEVLIRYGKFANATLLLDFGFTASSNRYDQVPAVLNIPEDDALYSQKLDLLDRHRTRSIKDVNEFTSSWNSFPIKDVQRDSRKGKGIPQSLRAFGRIVTCNSQQELKALEIEAARNDGRLARYPLTNKNREIAAHRFLFDEISKLVEEYSKCIKLLESASSNQCGKSVLRRKLAHDLLTGELRVVKSASAWLENYCSNLLKN